MMDSTNLDQTIPSLPVGDRKEVVLKKPKTRKNKPADPKTDKRRKENREPTVKQLATQFKTGNPGNTARRTMREHQKAYRLNMATIASTVIPEMMTNILYNAYENADYDPSHFMQVAKFVSEQAFGRASEWIDYDNEGADKTPANIPNIQILNINGKSDTDLSAIDQHYIETGYTEVDDDTLEDE